MLKSRREGGDRGPRGVIARVKISKIPWYQERQEWQMWRTLDSNSKRKKRIFKQLQRCCTRGRKRHHPSVRTIKLIRKGIVILGLWSVGTCGHQVVSRGAQVEDRGREGAQRTCANRSARAVVVPVVLGRSRPLGIVVVGHCLRRGQESVEGRRHGGDGDGRLSFGLEIQRVLVVRMRDKIHQKLRSNAICGAMEYGKQRHIRFPTAKRFGTVSRGGR